MKHPLFVHGVVKFPTPTELSNTVSLSIQQVTLNNLRITDQPPFAVHWCDVPPPPKNGFYWGLPKFRIYVDDVLITKCYYGYKHRKKRNDQITGDGKAFRQCLTIDPETDVPFDRPQIVGEPAECVWGTFAFNLF